MRILSNFEILKIKYIKKIKSRKNYVKKTIIKRILIIFCYKNKIKLYTPR